MEYYAKSCEEDFVLKTHFQGRLIPAVHIQDAISTGILLPHTLSFGLEQRLCCTALTGRFDSTYRNNGIIFTTDDNPSYVSPCDLMAFCKADDLKSEYYQMKDELDKHYHRELLSGYGKFLSRNVAEMLKKFPTFEETHRMIADFRRIHGFAELTVDQKRLGQYNEVGFYNPVAIKVAGIFGTSDNAKMMAQKFAINRYASAHDFP